MSDTENEAGEPLAKKPRKPRISKPIKAKSETVNEVIVLVDPEPAPAPKHASPQEQKEPPSQQGNEVQAEQA